MQLWAISRPRESSTMLCQLNYGGRYWEHDHEFTIYKQIYKSVMPIKWKVYSTVHHGVYIRPLTVELIIVKEENLDFLDILKPNRDLHVVKNPTLSYPTKNATFGHPTFGHALGNNLRSSVGRASH